MNRKHCSQEGVLPKKLRYMHNYSSLGAIVAGISGNAVYRLIQTRELVTARSQKEFMRLEILMGTQKGHFAYRLAWKNTTAPRIPFLPLHRRDLVSGDEGNRTYTDEARTRINWKKFEIMGEVIVSIQKSQSMPYPDLERKLDVQRLVLDCDLIKDEDVSFHPPLPSNLLSPLPFPSSLRSSSSLRRFFSLPPSLSLSPRLLLSHRQLFYPTPFPTTSSHDS